MTDARMVAVIQKEITYHLPSSDEDDMTDSKVSPKSIGFLCVSADPRRAVKTVGGETFILTMTELRIFLEMQRDMEDQQIWLTTPQAGFPTIPPEDEVSSLRDLQLGRSTVRLLHPEISTFIGRLQNEITSQNRPPSLSELKTLELERDWGTGDMGTDKDTENQKQGSRRTPPGIQTHPH